MNAFSRYPKYKDSGVEWLGEVPAHWEVNRVFSIFNERVETGHSHLPILNVTISNGVQVERFEGDRKKRLIEDRDAYKRAAAGDIAYNTMRMWQGAVGDVPVDGLVSPAYVVARPIKDINPRYYSLLFRGESFQVETNRHSYGIVSDRNRLYWLGFKNIFVPIPPRAEQDRIVAFLDEKTAEIDTLIAKKQRQIELLEEQKAILINRAVTRGLNSNVALKDSGVSWIGAIPEGWKIERFRYCAQIRCGQVDPRREPFRGMTLIAPDHIQSGTGRILGLETAESQGAESGKYRVNSGEIVYSKIRPNLRKACIAPIDCLCSADMYPIIPTPALDASYLLNYMLSEGFTKAASDVAMRVAMPKVNRESLADFPIVIPPISEQRNIVARLKEIEDTRRLAADCFGSQIDALQTLRATLIARTVTGQIAIPASAA